MSLVDTAVATVSEETTPAFGTAETMEAVSSLCEGLRFLAPEPHFLTLPAMFVGPLSESQHRQKRDFAMDTHVRHWADSMGYVINQRTEVVFFDAAQDLDQNPEVFRQRLARAAVPFVIVPRWDDCEIRNQDNIVALNRITEDAAGSRQEDKTYRPVRFGQLSRAQAREVLALLPAAMRQDTQRGGPMAGGLDSHWIKTSGCLLLLTAPASLQYADDNVRDPILDAVRDRCPEPVNILLSLAESWLREWEPIDLVNHVVAEFRAKKERAAREAAERYQEYLHNHKTKMVEARNYLTWANDAKATAENLKGLPVNLYEETCKNYMKYIHAFGEIELQSDRLLLKIPEFDVEDVALGPYVVRIMLHDYSVNVETTGMSSSNGYPHPHVSSNGEPCWGGDGFAEQVRNAVETGNLIELAAICIRHLKDSYSAEGAYQKLAHWEKDEDEDVCHECGEGDYHPDYHRTCPDCYQCYNPDHHDHRCPTCESCNCEDNRLAPDYCTQCDPEDLPEDLRKEHYPEDEEEAA